MAWLTGWDKRKEITVTENSAATLTDFQVKVAVTYDADMQADFDDIRFTDSDGETLLDHWLETKVDSTSATFWVKVPSIPSSSTATIYMYYGNAGASSASDADATFMAFDDFGRVTLLEGTTWTKSANNPLSDAGYGDPFIYEEGGTFYLFADDLTNDTIVAWSTGTPDQALASWTSHGAVLSPGTAGAWDAGFVRDPHIVKAGSTYHMWYGGQTDTTPSGTTHKIGHATSSSLTSGWSKDGSNPVFDLSGGGNGVNEPSVRYDANATAGEEYAMLYTYDSTGTADDVGGGNIGLAYSADGTTWSDQGLVLAKTTQPHRWQDQEQIQDSSGIWHLFVNSQESAPYTRQALSKDMTAWGTPTASGGIAPGAGGTYDDGGIFAPTVVLAGGTYYLFYQASDGADMRIALATSSAITAAKWHDTISAFSISSGRLEKSAGHASVWESLESAYAGVLPYTFETDLEFAAEDTGGYVYGIKLGQDATYKYGVIVDPSANQIGLWQTTYPEGTASTITSSTTSFTVALATAHKIRAHVTASNISIDWHDGTSWNTNILSRAGTYIPAGCGYYTFGNDGGSNQNQFYADNFIVRGYASSAPTVSFGSEETDPAAFQPRSGVAIANGVMMV